MDEIVASANELGHGATMNKLEVIAVDDTTKLDIIVEDRFDSQFDFDFDEDYFDPFKVCSCI
jgi:hypothetical protein